MLAKNLKQEAGSYCVAISLVLIDSPGRKLGKTQEVNETYRAQGVSKILKCQEVLGLARFTRPITKVTQTVTAAGKKRLPSLLSCPEDFPRAPGVQPS